MCTCMPPISYEDRQAQAYKHSFVAQGHGLILSMSSLKPGETGRYSTKLCSSFQLFKQTSKKIASINSEACDYHLLDLENT